jgi:hypothetical protein
LELEILKVSNIFSNHIACTLPSHYYLTTKLTILSRTTISFTISLSTKNLATFSSSLAKVINFSRLKPLSTSLVPRTFPFTWKTKLTVLVCNLTSLNSGQA